MLLYIYGLILNGSTWMVQNYASEDQGINSLVYEINSDPGMEELQRSFGDNFPYFTI